MSASLSRCNVIILQYDPIEDWFESYCSNEHVFGKYFVERREKTIAKLWRFSWHEVKWVQAEGTCTFLKYKKKLLLKEIGWVHEWRWAKSF